jgi:hypothetical protein
LQISRACLTVLIESLSKDMIRDEVDWAGDEDEDD